MGSDTHTQSEPTSMLGPFKRSELIERKEGLGRRRGEGEIRTEERME